jgi:glycosyltransferase involved in cell wall biosynthesis
MIVIASHNRIDLLDEILKSLTQIDLCGFEILVVDTGSTDPNYIHFKETIVGKYPQVIFDRREEKCYESGAFIHAIKNYRRDRYIFLQDSLVVTNKNFVKNINEKLENCDVLPFFNFRLFLHKNVAPYLTACWVPSTDENYYLHYDNMYEANWAEHGLQPLTYPQNAFWGNMFAVNRETLDKLPPEWLDHEPRNKTESCAMERRWALMFHKIGAKVEFLEYLTLDQWNIFHRGFFVDGNFIFDSNIRKVHINRQ